MCLDQSKIWATLAVAGAYTVLEYWLGKTAKTRASSVIELIVMGVTLVFALVLMRVRKDGRNKGS